MARTTVGSTRGNSPDARLPLARWAFLAALLFAEGAFLSIRIDVVTLQDSVPQWWAAVLAHTGWVLPVIAAVATATVLFSGARLREEVQSLFARGGRPRWSWGFLFAHVIAFLGFARVTTLLFAGELTRAAHPGWWGLAWLLLGITTVALWALIALPATLLFPISVHVLRAAPVGAAIGTLAWAAGEISESWWFVLQRAKFSLVEHGLALFTADVVTEPDQFVVGTSHFLIEIAPSCAGGEGIGLITTFVVAYLWFFRDRLRFPQAFLLVPLGIAAAWLANAVRLIAIVLVGSWLSADVALGGLHSHAGTLLFCGVALGVAVAAQRSPLFVRGEPLAARDSDNPTAAFLGPLLALVATSLITGTLTSSSSFDVLYPLRIVAAATALWMFRRQYREWRLTWSWAAIAVGMVVFALWIALAPAFADAAEPGELRAALANLPQWWAAVWILTRVLGAVVIVPLAEELAFRGYLTRRLTAADFQRVPIGTFTWMSFLVSSLLFGAMHRALLAGVIAGALYAVALYRRRQLGDAMLAHATTNGLLVLYVLFTGW